MQLTYTHFLSLILTVTAVIGCGMYAARQVRSAEGYSLGGRSAGATLIAGSIAGTVVGGGATVGTAQLAYSLGLSAWWFTLGSGIGFIIMGIFYAKPMRNTGLETIPQYLVLNYGKSAGPLASIIASIGIFLSIVASCLPGIQIIAAIFQIQTMSAAAVLVILVAAYVMLGGMKGAGVSGMLKLVIIWITLFAAGGKAGWDMYHWPDLAQLLPYDPWFSLGAKGCWGTLGNVGSLIAGILCTQTYVQAIFSAADSRTARIGALAAAAVVIPVGLPSVAIAMFMHQVHPGTVPMLVLPLYLLQYQPEWLGGVGLAGIILSLIGSIAGLALGIGTMAAKDLCSEVLGIQGNNRMLWANRLTVLMVTMLAAVTAAFNLETQVLTWNYLSMALRSGGVFLPLTLAIFAPGRLNPRWAVASMAVSTAAAILAPGLLGIAFDPLFIGLAVSAAVILLGLLAKAADARTQAADEESVS